MKMNGTYAFPYDQQAVWDILMDPNAIAKAIPGVKEMIPIEGEDHAWRAMVKIGVASVSGTYTGVIRMTDIEPPTRYRLTAEGEGQQSIISGSAMITLDPTPEKTVVVWDADASLSGKLASVAQRLIKSAAGLLSRQFFGSLSKQLKQRGVPQKKQTNAEKETDSALSPGPQVAGES